MGELIFLADRRPARLSRRAVISAICDTLIGNRRCLGLLAYENGRWVHAFTCRPCAGGGLICDDPNLHRDCPEPQPRQCAHPTCREPADPEQTCVTGDHAECDGCCWELDDQMEGARRPWTR